MQHPVNRLITVLALASIACGGGHEDYCRDNADCSTWHTCFRNRCLRLDPVPAGLAWEVIPDGSPRSQFFATPQTGQPIPLEYCASGLRGDASELGRIRVDLEGDILGVPGFCAFEQHDVSDAFQLPLPPGRWRMTAYPEQGPPLVRMVGVQPCEFTDLGKLEPPRSARFRFLFTMGEGLPEKRCGIRVQAFDSSTGDPLSAALEVPLDSRHRCTPPAEGWELEIAEPRNGWFDLVLETKDVAAPVMRRQSRGIRWTAEPELLEVETRSVAAERVVIQLLDPAGLPVAGAQIRAIWPPEEEKWQPEGEGESICMPRRFAADGDPAGAFRSPPATATAEPGSYELWLPPGPYRFLASPPPTTDLATTWTEDFSVRSGAAVLLALQLRRKWSIEGSVLGQLGDRLANVPVRAVPLSEFARPAQTRTDAHGFFRLRVDPGPYIVLAEPREDGLASNWAFLLEWKDSAEMKLELLEPRILAGTVRDATGETVRALANAVVRVWDLSGPRPVVAGQAVTDAEGRFVMRIRW